MPGCITSLSALGLLIAPVPTPVGPAATIAPDATSDSIALGREASRRMTVPVMIGGDGPHNFVVDTGSQRTVISSELAARLDLKTAPQKMLVSILDRRLVEMIDLPPLRIGRTDTVSREAPVLEARHMGADGILGLDSLGDKRIEIQNFGQCLAIVDRDSTVPDKDAGATIKVDARKREGQLILVSAEATGHPVYTVLDTGAEINVGNSRLLKLLRTRGGVTILGSRKIVAVTGYAKNATIGYIRELKIGDVRLHNLAVAFIDSPALESLGLTDEPTLIMGMNSMAAFERVLIDFPKNRITFVMPNMRVQPQSMSVLRRFGE